MQDDDKQPSYERLDETNPERSKRSFFDWLRGKEETEEERLRKKLDEDLKEAARQRAEQFEEERRQEEQREVAETKKLKKRWRAKLVEKSKQLLEDAAETGEEPANGYDIAKLMVAERIVKLHDMLQDETLDLRRSEVKSLKIHIDFMGLLSEKLDKPELEVPEEIHQLYETIAASVEETTGETLLPTPRSEELTPISENDVAYTAFAASIVTAIRRAVRPEAPTGSGAMETPEVRQSLGQTPDSTNSLATPEHPPLTEQLLAVVQSAALSGESIRKEMSQTEQARQLADVVERASMLNRTPRYEPQRSGSFPPVQPESHAQNEEKGFNLPPNKKIKYLSELELLQLAKTVEVGGGRLLADVYQKGELDREGLIKVLESYNKGRDYRSEFTIRRGNWQQHRAASQEYVDEPHATAPSSATTQSIQTSPETSRRPSSTLGKQTTSLAFSPQHASSLRPVDHPKDASVIKATKSQLAREFKERLQRRNQVGLLLASVLLLVIIFLVVINLYSR